MTRFKSLACTALLGTLAVASAPALAFADRGGRYDRGDRYRDRDHDHHSDVRVDINIGSGPVICEPARVEERVTRVWVEPVYRTVCDRVWIEPVYRDERVCIVGINTAHGWTLKEGRIPLRRLLDVAELLERVPETALKVVVAHHHLIPPPNFGTQTVLANAYEAIDVFSTVGVDLVLSGHQHQAYIGSSEEFYPKGRPPVVICHSGTTTSNRGRMGERERNSCNWIEFDDRSLTVSRLRWHRDVGAFAEHSRHWYPRQERVPFALEGLEPPAPRPAAVP